MYIGNNKSCIYMRSTIIDKKLWLLFLSDIVHWSVKDGGWICHLLLKTNRHLFLHFHINKRKYTNLGKKKNIVFLCGIILTKKDDEISIEILSGPLNECAWLYQHFSAIKIWYELMNRAIDCKAVWLNWIQRSCGPKDQLGSCPLSPSSHFYKKYDIFNAWSNLISPSSMKTP